MTNNDKYYDELVGQLGLFKKKEQKVFKPQPVIQQKPTSFSKLNIHEEDEDIPEERIIHLSQHYRTAKQLFVVSRKVTVFLRIAALSEFRTHEVNFLLDCSNYIDDKVNLVAREIKDDVDNCANRYSNSFLLINSNFSKCMAGIYKACEDLEYICRKYMDKYEQENNIDIKIRED